MTEFNITEHIELKKINNLKMILNEIKKRGNIYLHYARLLHVIPMKLPKVNYQEHLKNCLKNGKMKVIMNKQAMLDSL